MDKLLEELIIKYDNLLLKGKENLQTLEVESLPYKIQLNINRIWKFFLKDLRELADKTSHDDHKKGS